MKVIFFVVLFAIPLTSFAVRRVGFGGGDAENTVLRMVENIPAFSKACSENEGLCTVPGLKSPKIKFADGVEKAFCENDVAVLRRDDLYIDEKTPKDTFTLAAILVAGISPCQNAQFNSDKPLLLSPIGKKLPQTSLVALQGVNTDVLVSLRSPLSLHQVFKHQTGCESYRVTGLQNQMFLANCTNIPGSFLISVEETQMQIKLNTRYWSE